MSLLFHPDALKRIAKQDAARVRDKTHWLWTNRQLVDHLPLGENLSGFYRRRVGKYRIIYTYDSEVDDMIIRLVGLRDDIYKRLE